MRTECTSPYSFPIMGLAEDRALARFLHGSNRSRRRVLRRRWIVALVAAAVLVAGVGLVIARCPARRRSNDASIAGHAGTTTTQDRSTTTTTTTPPPTTTTTQPGALPQTGALPTSTDPTFAANMEALWNAVSTGTAQAALPAFFPEAAYVQLKAIGNAQADFSGRLVTEYEEDVSAAHQLLGSDAEAARFVSVNVNVNYAHWVPPGVCYNSVGYFEVPNSRVVYSINGQVSSFGIASMISWRGEWYIVHLGAILRSGSGGEVDDPQSGPGSPTYSSTC